MRDFLKWSVAHALHWAVLYGAFAADIDGAMYVLKFWVWVLLPLSLFLLADHVAASAAKKPRTPIRGFLSALQAWATLGLLVWFGHIASALAWGFVMLVVAVHRDKTGKARASTATSSA